MTAVIVALMPSQDVAIGESKNPIRIRTGLRRMLS
jgi:hypothetical protein